MANSSKAGAAADEQPPSVFPEASDATEKGKRCTNRSYPGLTLEG